MEEENKKPMRILKDEGRYIIDETTGATKKNSQNKDKLLKIKKYGNWNFKKLQWGKGWKIHLIESRMKRQKMKQERKNRNNKMKRRKQAQIMYGY